MSQEDQEYLNMLNEDYDACNSMKTLSSDADIIAALEDECEEIGYKAVCVRAKMKEYFRTHDKYGMIFEGFVNALRMLRLNYPLYATPAEARIDEIMIRKVFEEFKIPLYIKSGRALTEFVFDHFMCEE